MHAKRFFILIPVLVLALTAMACNLTSVVLSTPTPGLFDTPTAAPTLPLLQPTGQPTVTSTQPPPVVVVTTSTNTTAPSTGNATPTPPPTVVVTPLKPLATKALPQPTPVVMATQGKITLKIFMIAMNDNGASGPKVGCGDSAVAVNVQVPYTQAVLRTALTELLAQKTQNYGESGLYNALYQSNLTIDSLVLQNGEAIIKLSGQLASGGVCDDPRIIAQIERTALQFSTVNKVTIYVNGKKIQDLLSGRG